MSFRAASVRAWARFILWWAPLPPLRDDELLGREVFRRREADKAAQGTIRPSIFEGPIEANSLSVDRLDHASDEEMTKIGDRNAVRRGTGRSFYGWADITVAIGRGDARAVRWTPLPGNRYHADIDLRLDDLDRLDEMRGVALELAAKASWRRRWTPLNNL